MENPRNFGGQVGCFHDGPMALQKMGGTPQRFLQEPSIFGPLTNTSIEIGHFFDMKFQRSEYVGFNANGIEWDIILQCEFVSWMEDGLIFSINQT